jgi:hypothetical protein
MLLLQCGFRFLATCHGSFSFETQLVRKLKVNVVKCYLQLLFIIFDIIPERF